MLGAPTRLALVFTVCVISQGSANDLTPSNERANVARQLGCDGGGPGFLAKGDSGACARIIGYVAAGAISAPDDRIGGRPARFGPLVAPRVVTSVGASTETIVAPAGPGRILMQVDHDDFAR